METTYKRHCPVCEKEMIYSSPESYYHCRKKNTKCLSCAKKGENNPRYGKIPWIKGKKVSDEIKQQISKSKSKKPSGFLGKKHTEETKNQMSKVHKDNWKDVIIREKLLKICGWKNKSYDKGQLELLEKWNKLGFNFEPNYQIKTDIDLFYLDGYDKEKNVVLEYDSKHHKRVGQKEKDLIRQQKIINILKPKKFWRYDAVDKQIKNII